MSCHGETWHGFCLSARLHWQAAHAGDALPDTEVVMEPDRGGPQASGPRKGRYANALQVGHNAFEFVLDFGQGYQEGQEVQWHTRIVTGPAYARAFFEALHTSLMQYEKSFGAVPPREA